jgi:LmbE family N-acetylglucosaminyl deacetylase
LNVLVVAAHPDDEIIGCGATLRRLAMGGHAIYSCVLSKSAAARSDLPTPARLSMVIQETEKMIGIAESLKYDFANIEFNVVPHLHMVRAIEAAIVRFRPAWIFTHHPGDLNIDHRVTYETVAAAAMLPQRLTTDLAPTMVKKLFLFEIPSSTDWALPTSPSFRPNSFFDVASTLDDKVAALEAFDGALKPFPHSRSIRNIRNLAHLRGAQIGIEAAEAFCLVREVND